MQLDIPVRNVDSKDCVPKASGKSEKSRGHSCYILEQTVAITFLCPEILSEAEFRSNGLINGTQMPLWLLVATLSQVNSKNWEEKAGQKFLKNLQFDWKRKSCQIGAEKCGSCKDQHY